MKQKGILLPIFSLPSKYGIGDFGYEAYELIDILSENEIDYWEILPIYATEKYPYSPQSYYALNTDYISLDKLRDMDLLDDIEDFNFQNSLSYKEFKEKYYKKAYIKFEHSREFLKFKDNTKIQEYTKFISKRTGKSAEYCMFLQYIVNKQWNELREYAKIKNVKFIGDMPIYPAFESAELEYYSNCYQLQEGKMEFVSGVPSDKFNKDGQIWGTPVYNYNELKKYKFMYLVDRYKEALNKFDIVRIDHFIGYDFYYKIPINQSVDKGVYEQAAGYDFFNELMKITSKDRFIVEDLGVVRESTISLKNNFGFVGSDIVQYAIDLEQEKDEVFNKGNIVLYSGTHDCNTVVGWYNSLDKTNRMKLQEILKERDSYSRKINKAIIKYCMNSNAKIVIIPVQDILGLEENARINVPGKDLEQNWNWMLKNFKKLKRKIKYFSKL